MTAQKDKLSNDIARIFIDFVSQINFEWDSCYFRFVQNGPSSRSYHWSYVIGRSLELFNPRHLPENVLRDQQGKYFALLNSDFVQLFDEIQGDGSERPVVAVLKIDRDRDYNIKFDYSDPRALEIGKIGLGKECSYFVGTDIEIPDDVKRFQDDLAKVD